MISSDLTRPVTPPVPITTAHELKFDSDELSSAVAIGHEAAPKPMRRNMPDLLAVLLLGRLVTDGRYHNQSLRSALLCNAIIRALSVVTDAGVFAVMVHANSGPARQVDPY